MFLKSFMKNETIYIGLDSKHRDVFEICKFSIQKHLSRHIEILPVNKFLVPDYNRINDGFESTDFSFARFFVPQMNNFEGTSLFVDGDFLFLSDVSVVFDMFHNYNSSESKKKALMCCQHDYTPKTNVKMDGKTQTFFKRKNWSSFMIIDNAHKKIKTLNTLTINGQSGKFLHQFDFLEDSDIGEISLEWNWLVGYYTEISGIFSPKALHFTDGGPWLENYKNCPYSDIYTIYKNEYERL